MKTKSFLNVRASIMTLAILSAALFLVNCRGSKGPEGPEGPAGISYVHGTIYDVSWSSWTGNANGYTTNLNVPEITSTIYNTGAVLVYLLNESDPTNVHFNMLPFTTISGTSITYMDYDAYIGYIKLTMRWVDNGVNDTQAPTTTTSFKVVVVDGIPMDVLKNEVNIRDYSAVTKYLGLDKQSGTINK
jgi:hypothetical protein